MAQQMEPGDLIVFYLTRVKAFGGAVRITGEMYEDRSKVWPGKPGKPDPYPWRFETEPEVVLDEDAWVPAEDLAAAVGARPEVAGGALDARVPGPAANGVGRRSGSDFEPDAVTAERVRTLLLRGDNVMKSARPERFGRAREAFEEAREAAAATDDVEPGGARTGGAADRGAGGADRGELVKHERHYTLDEANAALAWVDETIAELRTRTRGALRRGGARGAVRGRAPERRRRPGVARVRGVPPLRDVAGPAPGGGGGAARPRPRARRLPVRSATARGLPLLGRG